MRQFRQCKWQIRKSETSSRVDYAAQMRWKRKSQEKAMLIVAHESARCRNEVAAVGSRQIEKKSKSLLHRFTLHSIETRKCIFTFSLPCEIMRFSFLVLPLVFSWLKSLVIYAHRIHSPQALQTLRKNINSLPSFTAVRYGRVPKRTRDIGGNSIEEDRTTVVSNSIVLTNIRVVNAVSSSTSIAPSVTNSSSSYLSSSIGNGGSQTALLVSSQMCSTTTTTPPIEQIAYISSDMIEASHMNNNNNNNNNSDDNQELSVYDVILCVSQAHRTHCTYTESVTKGLNHRPLIMPNNHHQSTASTINPNNLITSSSPTTTTHQCNSMDDNGVSSG